MLITLLFVEVAIRPDDRIGWWRVADRP